MPVYEVTDNEGRKLQLDGDSPPTEGELETIFDKAFPRSPSQRPAVMAPGETTPTARGSILTPVPQAFPAVEQAREETAKLPAMSLAEAEQILSTPQVSLPRVGEPGTVTRGLSELGSGLVEQALLTPLSPALGLATVVPGVRVAAGALLSAAGTKAAAEKLGEASVTGNRQTMTEGIGLGALSALGGVATAADAIARVAPATAMAVKDTVQTLAPKTPTVSIPREVKLPGVTMFTDEFPDAIRLGGITVEESQRGKGIGTQAMNSLIERADSEGKPIYLTASTSPDKQAALNRFYERLGFEHWKDDPLSGKPMYRRLPKQNKSAPETQTQAEPSQALGVAPAGTGTLQKVIDAVMPRDAETPPPITLKPGERLPSPRPFQEAKKVFAQPFGMGKLPVLGMIADANQRVRTPVQESVNTYYSERFGLGPAISSALGEEIRGTIDPYFTKDPKTGAITNIKPNREGLSLQISDVFETLQREPDAYTLSSEQRAAVERANSVMKDIDELSNREGVSSRLDDELPGSEATAFDAPDDVKLTIEKSAYFPRVVVERPNAIQHSSPQRGSGLGAKQFFQKSRMFDSEAEGVSRGMKYDPSIERRLVVRAERTYKAIADKRFASDQELGAVTRADLKRRLETELADKIASGEITPERIEKILDSKAAQGRVYEPALQNLIFEPETAAFLNKNLPRAHSELAKIYQTINGAARDLTLSGDISAPFIQLLPTMYSNPIIWSKAVGNGFKALANPRAMEGYYKNNIEPVREMAQLGSSVGQREALISGGQGKSFLQRTKLGKVFAPFNRFYTAVLDVAKTELWKAWREVTPPEQRLEVLRTLESQLGIARVESAGIKHNQAFAERAILLANSYYRGSLNYIALLGQKGVSGQIARRGIGALLAGGAATYIGIAKGLGMSDEDIQERLDPRRGTFMMWSVKVGDKVEEIGFGGFYKSLLRLAGNSVKTSIEHPENWASLATDKNPITRFLRGHSALVPGMVFTQLSGSDFLGDESTIGDILPSIATPLASRSGADYIRAKMSGEQPDASFAQVAVESLASFAGLSAWGESKRNQLMRMLNENAKDRFGKEYGELPIARQRDVAQRVQSMDAFKSKKEPTKREREMAFQADIDRVIRVRQSLPEEQAKTLDSLGVKLRGFDPSLTIGQVKVPLTRQQSERYEELIKEEYGKVIKIVLPALEKLATPELRQKALDKALTEAREAAKGKLMSQVKP